MRFLLKSALALTAACVAAVVLFVGFTLPERTRVLPPPAAADPPVVFGAYHVHTVRSDGSGTKAQVAAAAAAAGLEFVILTDHGDATRPPDPPAYLDGVLMIDAVEIGSDEGHVVALGLESPAPYPLGGRAADVIDDVHRMGGVAVAAHPDSPKAGLQWRAAAAPYDGVEWINADSEWRDESASRLLATLARSLVRGPESVASLFAPPARSLRRWDTASRLRPVFGLAAVDAHARLGADDEAGQSAGPSLAVPGYEVMFRTLAQGVLLATPLSGDAQADGRVLVAALAGGRTFSVVRAQAWPPTFSFTASTPSGIVESGGRIDPGQAVEFIARVDGVPDAVMTIVRNGEAANSLATPARASAPGDPGSSRSATLSAPMAEVGAYRAEVSLPGRDVPWIVSSPIRVGPPALPDPMPVADPPQSWQVIGPEAPWGVEHEPRSTGTFDWAGGEVRFDYALGAGVPSGQFAALAVRVGGQTGFDRIAFTARADRPMRISLQARLPPGDDGQRWRRSIYVDQTPRLVTVRLQDLQPVEAATTQRPVVAHVRGVLVVIDTVNTAPGARGTVWIRDLALGVGR